MTSPLPLLASLLSTLLTALAGAQAPSPTATGPAATDARVLNIVATTGMIADTARVIVGGRATVTALMGPGVDPHLYKATPGDLRTMSQADVILYNGLHLEGRLADVLVRMAARRTTVRVTETISEDSLRSPPEFDGHDDPHVWFDPRLWRSVAERIRDALIAAAPSASDEFTARTTEFLRRLDSLDAWARAGIETIPTDARVLITAHDAFGYFGRAYGLEVLAIQGISTDSEASLRGINELVDILVARRIPAVFVESSVPRKTIEALVEGCNARGHSVRIGGELFSDALGADGTPEGTYLGMFEHNVRTIVEALGGTLAEQAALKADESPASPAPQTVKPGR